MNMEITPEIAAKYNIKPYRLIATCQYNENYGTPEAPYWKHKYTCEYVLLATDDANLAFNMTKDEIRALCEKHKDVLNYSNSMSENILVDCAWVTELTWFEASQLEYDREIQYVTRNISEGI